MFKILQFTLKIFNFIFVKYEKTIPCIYKKTSVDLFKFESFFVFFSLLKKIIDLEIKQSSSTLMASWSFDNFFSSFVKPELFWFHTVFAVLSYESNFCCIRLHYRRYFYLQQKLCLAVKKKCKLMNLYLSFCCKMLLKQHTQKFEQ